MAIRLNLLAEAQAAEDMRRRDPVKRAIWVSALAISMMLVWSSSVQLKGIMANRELSNIEGQMNEQTNAYRHVVDNQKRMDDVRRKTVALHQLSTNRFLHGSLLNAIQQTNVDSVHLVRLRTEFAYSFVEEVKGRTNEGKFIPGKPATASERALLTLDATDSSVNPGDQVNKYKEAVNGLPYVRELLGKTNVVNLKNLSQPQFSTMPGPSAGKASVLFTLESRLPEKTR